MVKDIYPGGISSNPKQLTVYNDALYFQANACFSASNTTETLWKSDGTAAGTVLVSPTNKPGFPRDFVVCNNQLFFCASSNAAGFELWKSDGTNSGTVLVKDIYVGASNNGSPQKLINVNGQLFFFANNGTLGQELWKSDGTDAGTNLIKDINPGPTGSYESASPDIYTACAIGNFLYFRANNGINGSELWRSDGTSAGTIMLKDIYSGTNSSYPNAFINFNDKLIFSSLDGVKGTEIWSSDVTINGTVLLKDIYEGSSGSTPYAMNIFNNKLFFTAATFIAGRELWSYNGNVLSTNIPNENKLELGIYPNPASNILNISLANNFEVCKILVTDLSGKMILEQNSNLKIIDIENLANGIYVLEVFTGEKKMVGKFIKQ